MDGDLIFAVMLGHAVNARPNATDEMIASLTEQCAQRTEVVLEALKARGRPKETREKKDK